MLHSINLLPWREQQRILRQKKFVWLLGLGVGLAVLSLWGTGAYIEQQQGHQRERNQYLARYLLQLDERIKQLTVVEQQHHALLTRLAQVERLQVQRNKTTDFMNLLPQLIPQGVYVDKLNMTGLQVELAGISDSTSHLATMLDNLEKSPVVTDVEMHSIVHGTMRLEGKYQAYNVSFSLTGGKNDQFRPGS